MIHELGRFDNFLKCQNPFVFTVYHNDLMPPSDGSQKPSELRLPDPKEGDLDWDSPWRMYYGEEVPGFPAHPHRGLETVTVLRQGCIDHTDGLGGRGRYMDGDTQWMTAGKGLQHAEMFPLRFDDRANPLQLFQIWLSLDNHKRMVEPAYKMIWQEETPVLIHHDRDQLETRITLIAGELNGQKPPAPTEDSYASDPSSKLSIQLLDLQPGAYYEIPAGDAALNRSLYFYEGHRLDIEGQETEPMTYAFVSGDEAIPLLNNGQTPAQVLLLEAVPISGPIVHEYAYVMNTEEEILQAKRDFAKTGFGGWPFDRADVYYEADQGRFAVYTDGAEHYPPES